MLIREYQASDRESCLNLFRSNTPGFFTVDEIEEFGIWLNELEQANTTEPKRDYYFVAEQKHQVVACGGFHINPEASLITMTWGMVDRSRQGQGIERKLLEYRIQRIRSLYPDFVISLDTTQHSYRFFEKLGFQVTRVTENYYDDGTDRYDMILR